MIFVAVVANYTYDAWGRLLSVKNASGSTISDASHIANVNPIRYRGYFYDTETKLYYCNSRYYDPQVKRFINADDEAVLFIDQSNMTQYNLFAYCLNNPVNMYDDAGTLPKWLKKAVEAVAVTITVAAVVVTASMVIAGTGGVAATIGLGVATSAFNGGYMNKKAGGSFTAGSIGGAIGGFVQNVSSHYLGYVGTIVGGGICTGLGTYVTETIDNHFVAPKEKRLRGEIIKDSLKTGAVGMVTSAPTAFIGGATKMAVDNQGYGLMEIDEKFGNVINAFFSAVDDAMTYLLTMN